MKLKYLLIAVLAGAALVGCQRENGNEERDGNKNYMGFTIAMPSATKADNTGGVGTYEVGQDYENQIKTIHFFFYRNGTYVSWGYGDMAGKFKDTASTGNVEETLTNPDIAKAGQGVVVLESTMTMPNQVLCVINSRDFSWYRNKSLETVMAAIHSGTAESITKNETDSYKDFQDGADTGNPYFVMITSPMYGNNASGTKEIKYVSDIFVEETAPGSGIFTANSYIKNTPSEAEAKPVEIFVERMAARFDVPNAFKEYDSGKTLTDPTNGILAPSSSFVDKARLDASLLDASGDPLWDIEPLAWSVTAANKKAYNLKKINIDWFSKTGANQPFNGGWLMSGTTFENPLSTGDFMNTRINWAEDPNYNNPTVENRDAYPHSARELLTVSEQHYWSANEVIANYGATEKTLGDIQQRYSYENTFGQDGQKFPRINGTMVLLYAKVKKAGKPVEDLFAYMGQMQTEKEYIEHLLSTMDAHGYTFYIDDAGTKKKLHENSDKAKLKVAKATTIKEYYSNNKASMPGAAVSSTLLDAYPDMIVDLSGTMQANKFESNFNVVPSPFPTANKEKGYADGYVTMVPDTGMPELYVEDKNTATNPGYDSSIPGSEFRTAMDAEIAEGFLNGVVEPANMYRDGMMYYAIPIEHFGKAKTAGTTPEPLEGNYGVVRNNLYQVAISTFKTLGHGIDDPDEPIVPGDRKKPYYIAAKINILSWQIVTMNNVELAE